MVTFIHTSDWHIGNPFVPFDRETAVKLNRARLTAVEAIFIYAQKKNIPLILGAGDVIDNGRLAPEKHLLDLFAIIRRYPGINVVIITGNHDPLMANTIYQRVAEDNYPPNLHLVKTSKAIIPLESLGLTIFAASTLEKNGTANPLGWVTAGDIDREKINVGLAHGGIKNERYDPQYFPIEPGNARAVGLDYLALGDWHSYKAIDDRTYYCGTPEPLQFGDIGYPLEVSIERPGAVPTVEPITGIRQYRWTHHKIEVSDARIKVFRQTLESVREKEIKKLTISGYLSAANYKIYHELIQINHSRYFAIEDRVSIAPGAGDLLSLGDSTIQGMVQRLLDMKKSNEPLAKDVLNYVVPVDQQKVTLLSQEITKNEIIDRALLKLYKQWSATTP